MHFKIRSADKHLWTWVLLDATDATVMESPKTFPSQTQASAAALAFAAIVGKAARKIVG
ncbi:hypothetical protein ACRBEV_32675 (plasmid) [Methylobacterium phyllosphaerae]